MADRQIQELQPQELPLGQRTRTRSLAGQISAALLQPVYFFRTLAGMGETRQWLWVALLIMGIIGLSAVRQQSLASTTDTGINSPTTDFGGGDFSGDPGGKGIPGGDGGFPLDGGIPDGGITPGDGTDTGTAGTASVNDTLTTGIIAASSMMVGWFILTILLSEVSLLKGRAPKPGKNFQIAIWSSLPMALMALFQVLYFAAGGTPGKPGLAGLLPEWSEFTKQAELVQALLISLASSTTIFWLWALMMLYFGARFALNGSRFASVLVVICWVLISIVTPVVTGAIKAPETVVDLNGGDGLEVLPPDFSGEQPPTDGLPGGEFSTDGDVESPVETQEAGSETDGDVTVTEEAHDPSDGEPSGDATAESRDSSSDSSSDDSSSEEGGKGDESSGNDSGSSGGKPASPGRPAAPGSKG
ncbi:MAG TPA: Yip1 family protein [Phototrophicaceae bacterium]|jgi:hypothetical protein|nr:Yip1 family protein [Phototrophicaceae bacterium]